MRKNLANSKARDPTDLPTSTAPEPEPKPFVPTVPKLNPCLGCRQPFLRIKRPITLNGLKFPYENECDYCGPCRSGIFAELREDDCKSSQPVFFNPVVTTQMEAKSTSSSTIVISSTSYSGTAKKKGDGMASDKRNEDAIQKVSARAETDFGERMRTSMARRNEALQQTEITAKTEAAMALHRGRMQSEGKSSGITATTQASFQAPKS